MKQSNKRIIFTTLAIPFFALTAKSSLAVDAECAGSYDWFRTVLIGVEQTRGENGQCNVNYEYLRTGCSGGSYSSFTFTRFARMKCA
jgi:hypothetical protein